MLIRNFDVKGKEIKGPIAPCYRYLKNSKEDVPPDFVTISQLEIQEVVTDPYGQSQTITKLSSPVEEVYNRWVWENEQWNCVVVAVVKNKQIVLDRRPSWWKFLEEFNGNRPRSING